MLWLKSSALFSALNSMSGSFAMRQGTHHRAKPNSPQSPYYCSLRLLDVRSRGNRGKRRQHRLHSQPVESKA